MRPALRASDRLEDEDRLRLAVDVRSELVQRTGVDAVGRAFPETNDAAGHMPSGPEQVVVSPRQERPPTLILDEQIDVHERSQAADQLQHVLRQSGARLRQ